MPVILKPEAFDAWLDQENQDTNFLLEIIKSKTYTELISIPVSKQVNPVGNNGLENIRAKEHAYLFEPKTRAHSPQLAAGLASESKSDRIPYGRCAALPNGRTVLVACCEVLQLPEGLN